MGQITLLSVAGSLFQNLASKELVKLVPGAPFEDILQLTTGRNSPLFKALNPGLQIKVIEQITVAIRNPFAIVVAGSSLALISSLFLSVSFRAWFDLVDDFLIHF